MKKWWLLLLSLVIVFAFAPTSFAKSKGKVQKASGVVSAVDAQAGTIEIKSKSNTAVALLVDSSSKVKLAGFKNSGLSDIWVGDRAEAVYEVKNATNVVKEMVVTKQKGSVKGEVTSIDVEGLLLVVGEKQISVTDKTVIKMGKSKVTLAELVVGDKIEAKGYLKEKVLQASEIEIKRTMATLKGNVESVLLDKKQLVVAGTTVTISADTKIRLFDKTATLTDILVNDKVVVVGSKRATEFVAKIISISRTQQEVEGEITALDTANKTITIGEKIVTVNEQTKLQQDDKPVSLEQLQVGEKVEAKGYTNGDKWIAVKIKVESDKETDEDDENDNEDHE